MVYASINSLHHFIKGHLCIGPAGGYFPLQPRERQVTHGREAVPIALEPAPVNRYAESQRVEPSLACQLRRFQHELSPFSLAFETTR